VTTLSADGRRPRLADDAWAEPHSLLGLLQRGRGLGLRRALGEAEGAELVCRCLEEDARWDSQLEERGVYFARLLTGLRIGPDDLDLDLSSPDLSDTVAFDTLLELARQGSASAGAHLLEHLRRVPDGPGVTGLIGALWSMGAAAPLATREVVLEALDDATLAEIVRPDEDGPWAAWADDPRVARALVIEAGAQAPGPPHRPDLSALDRGALLHAAFQAESSRRRSAAFAELAHRGDRVLLDLAERPELRNRYGYVPSLASALVDLGTAALPRARSWLADEDTALQHLGQQVVAACGGRDDAAVLLRLFDGAVDSSDWLGTEPLADALLRVEYVPAVSSVVRAWSLTQHSHARAAYLKVLVGLGAPEASQLIDEAYDDCESEVRVLAVAPGAGLP
jgi:hypothetical protein